jgi:branched-chain amino acid transport system substrate-binding protein
VRRINCFEFFGTVRSTGKGEWKMKKEGKKITRRAFLKKVLVAGGIAVIVMGLSAFPQYTLHAQPKEVKVGAILPLTGGLAHWGHESEAAIELAAQMINEEGGIKSMGGAKVKAVIVDFESKPEVAAIQAEI